MFIGIICYKGYDVCAETTETRSEFHKRQLTQLIAEIPEDQAIYVYAQRYKESDFIFKDRVTYVIHPDDEEVLSPGDARNKLLDIFYKTDDKWALFLDDDCIINAKYYGGIKQLYKIEEQTDDYKFMGIIVPHYGQVSPFSHIIMSNYDNLIDLNRFEPTLFTLGTCMFIKKLDEKIYFDSAFARSEDMDFALQYWAKGEGAYSTFSLNISAIGTDESIISKMDYEDMDLKQIQECRKNEIYNKMLLDKWPQYVLRNKINLKKVTRDLTSVRWKPRGYKYSLKLERRPNKRVYDMIESKFI